MTEREKLEKVIKGLECCVGYENDDNKYTCIYDGDTNPECPYGGTGSNGVSCMTKLMRDALILLKAEEPVENDQQFLTHIISEICDYAKAHDMEPNETLETIADNIKALLEISTFNGWKGR